MPEVLRGDLGTISLAGLLQLVEAESLTGTLTLEPQGKVQFAMGQPVGAACRGRDGLTGFLELFLEAGGGFQFQTGAASGTSLGSMLGLIMEGCRLSDEWRQLGGLFLIPTGNTDADGPVATLLGAMDGSVTVHQAVERAGVARVEVVDPLRDMVELGVLHEVTTAPAPPRAHRPSTEGYGSAMEEGRRRLRSGDFDGAEASFQLALTLRPDDTIARQNLRRVQQVRNTERQGFNQWFRRH